MTNELVDLVHIMYPKKSNNVPTISKNPPPKVGTSWGRPIQTPKPNTVPNNTVQKENSMNTPLSEYISVEESTDVIQDTYSLMHSRR